MPLELTSKKSCQSRFPLTKVLGIRSGLLFLNFLLIITAVYHLKPASRSLFIESLGADRLPYVWIGTALSMIAIISLYHKLVVKNSRIRVVLTTCFIISSLLVCFRFWVVNASAFSAMSFYIFVDILSVVLVEQFWSLTNSSYTTKEGKRWYGFIGTGGLVGGVIGGMIAFALLKKTSLQTADLLLVAAGIIGLIALLTYAMGRLGLYCEAEENNGHEKVQHGWQAILSSRYLVLIAAILLLAQLASPLIEYQFMKTVESNYLELEARTAFLSQFFSILGMVSIFINLAATPLIHKHLGVFAGLLAQPLLMGICTWGFFMQPNLLFGSASKISDRGLSYSINRASKELLYVPVAPVLIYQAKAWIDMFGYRLFKVFGSLLILVCTQWLPIKLSPSHLSVFVLSICLVWIGTIMIIRRDYIAAFQK